jgi:threonine synthase
VPEGYAAAVDLSRAAARAFGWLDRNTGANPLTIEAKKTVVFEVWEQLGRRVPDVMIVPVGDGPTSACSTRASPSWSAAVSPRGNRV